MRDRAFEEAAPATVRLLLHYQIFAMRCSLPFIASAWQGGGDKSAVKQSNWKSAGGSWDSNGREGWSSNSAWSANNSGYGGKRQNSWSNHSENKGNKKGRSS